VDNPHRGIQEIYFRHRFREGLDVLIDELHGPGSLLWSPDGAWLVINHRDYGSLHDFVVFHLERRGLVERRGMTGCVQQVWDRLHPEPMSRLSFQSVRWSAEDQRLLVLVIGEPEAEGAAPVRETFWLDPTDGVVRQADAQ
jgi:hypothetical protein